jgi:hypothetical protein
VGSEKHAAQWSTTLGPLRHAGPGHAPVAAITPDHVAQAVAPIWVLEARDSPSSQAEDRTGSSATPTFAQAATAQPGSRLRGALEHLRRRSAGRFEHHAALPWQAMPELMQAAESNSLVSEPGP